MNIKRPLFLHTVKALLLLVCLYSSTALAENKMQRLVQHSYSSYPYVYFTTQTLYLSLLTSALGAMYRISRKSRSWARSVLFGLLNTVMPVTLSLEVITTGVFWPLYFYNKKLVIHPRYTDPGYETPVLTELGKHLFPLAMLLLEQADIPLEKTIYQSLFLVGYLLSYYALVTVFAMKTGKYLYPFLNAMGSEVFRAAFFTCILATGYSVYFYYMRYKAGTKTC